MNGLATNGTTATTQVIPRLQDLPDVLTPEQVAEVLQCARSTVYDLCRTRRIPAVKVGRLVRIPRDRFVRWLQGEETGRASA